jgi:uncharacterized protein YbaR (Trm112 family)/SAM-dependent methyltransferase
MTPALHDILQCPFCGGTLQIADSPGTTRDGDTLLFGTLYCSCCAYPVVDGIPYMLADEKAGLAIKAIDAGDRDLARETLLGIAATDRATQLRTLMKSGDTFTFARTLELLGPGAEADYFLHRFSDPRLVNSDALLRAMCHANPTFRGRALDLCGGTGHLTRTLVDTQQFGDVVLADLFFWKIWLGKRFIVPSALAVACDGDRALPFLRESFDLVFCSGAFEYVWSRYALGQDMQRIVSEHGAVLLTHLKNILCDTFNPGMPLDPGGYRRIFSHWPTKMYGETELFESVMGGGPIDLSRGRSDEELEAEPGLILLCSKADVFCACAIPEMSDRGTWVMNPLYQRVGESDRFKLTFPTEEYEAEFGESRRYLPDEVDVKHMSRSEQIRRRVLLNLPERYV